ncbi:DUF1573 domain-containing protein [Limibacter armeniacum]|uniref:DUF1573 domain-containing protein n=1 Tax=Limibacter armeniacum TaxID=466084 RepID=UPI002FE61974
MRKTLTAAFLLCLLMQSASIFAQKALVFKTPKAYLGKTDLTNEPIIYDFLFDVTSYAPVTLKEVETDCSCTIAEFPDDKLKKGDTGAIRIEFHPYKAGPFNKTFKVKLDGSKEIYELEISGTIEPSGIPAETRYPFMIGPLRFEHKVVNLGTVKSNGTVRKTVTFFNDNDYAVELEKAPLTPKHIAINFEGKPVVPAHSAAAFDIFYNPADMQKVGYAVDNIRFFTNDSLNQYVDLPVIASVVYTPTDKEENNPDKPSISILNRQVELGKIKLSEYRLVSIKVMNNGKSDLEIQKVETDEGCELMGIDSKNIKPYQTVNINVKFLDTGEKGKQVRTLTIFSNDPLTPIQKVVIQAEVQ